MDKINVLQLQLNSGYGCGVSTYVKNIVSRSPNCRYFVSLNESLTDDIVQEKLQPIYKQVEKFIRLNISRTKNSFTFFDPPYYLKGPGLYTNFYNNQLFYYIVSVFCAT